MRRSSNWGCEGRELLSAEVRRELVKYSENELRQADKYDGDLAEPIYGGSRQGDLGMLS